MNNYFAAKTLKMTTCLFCLSSILTATTALATETIITHDGFYIGGDFGSVNLMNHESHSINPESHQLARIGLIGGGYVGYDFCLANRFRNALEIYLEGTGATTQIEHNGNTYKMKQNYNFGIRWLPQYAFTPFTTGHFIFGYNNGYFQLNDNGVYGFINTNYHRNGLQLGAGFTITIVHNFFLRLDAIYNSYASQTQQGTGLPGQPPQQYTNRFSMLARELSFIYKFC